MKVINSELLQQKGKKKNQLEEPLKVKELITAPLNLVRE